MSISLTTRLCSNAKYFRDWKQDFIAALLEEAADEIVELKRKYVKLHFEKKEEQ